jgi:hypothetical protein
MISLHEPTRSRPGRSAVALVVAALVTAFLAGCTGQAASNSQSGVTGPEVGEGETPAGRAEVTEVLDRLRNAGTPCEQPREGLTAVSSLPGARCAIDGQPASIAAFADQVERDRFVNTIRAGASEQQAWIVMGESWAISVRTEDLAERIAEAADGRVLAGAFQVR